MIFRLNASLAPFNFFGSWNAIAIKLACSILPPSSSSESSFFACSSCRNV